MRRTTQLRSISAGLLLLSATALSCGGGQDPCQVVGCRADAGTPIADASAAEGGPDGGTVDPLPEGCTPPNDNPLKNPEKCLVDSFGAFVSPTGDDANPGTKAKPLKTIGKALEGTKSRVVVCEGTYAEALEIKRDVELYGGLACSFDKAGGATKIESGKLVGLAVTSGVVGLFEVDVTSKEGKDPGESSIGVSIGAGVTFKMIGGTVTAGAGASAQEAGNVSNYSSIDETDPKIKGNDATTNSGAPPQTCSMLGCVEPPPVVEGGGGGVGSAGGGASGLPGKTAPSAPVGMRGLGGDYDVGNAQCRNGNRGNDGDPGSGGAGAGTPGTLEAGKWVTSRGASGQTARAGQGGGGGSGGQSSATGGGGSGGCGGCGGGKGQGGLSGGSSFAVLSNSANVTLDTVTLRAGAGGKGGKGGDGQVGQTGGNGGSPAQVSVGCPGGHGGQGGQGGGGGGGAGGHSIAVAYTGTKPALKNIKPEVSATPALGGDPGATGATAATKATSGQPGKVGAELAL